MYQLVHLPRKAEVAGMQGEDVGCRERCDHTFSSREENGFSQFGAWVAQGAPPGITISMGSMFSQVPAAGGGKRLDSRSLGEGEPRCCPAPAVLGLFALQGRISPLSPGCRIPLLSLHTFTASPLPFSACQGRQCPSHCLCASTGYFGNVHHGTEQEMMDCLEKE